MIVQEPEESPTALPQYKCATPSSATLVGAGRNQSPVRGGTMVNKKLYQCLS